MSEMDELLAQLKAEYKQKKPPSPSPKPSSSATPSPQKSNHQSGKQLDNLLADLKAEFNPEKPKQKDKPPQKRAKPTSVSPSSGNRSTPTYDNNLIESLKEEYQAQEREEQKRRQQELAARQKREQEREKRRRQALRQEAQEWLKNLNLNSDEGLWFEEFSYSYDSKLEAAIDYLQAIRETRRLG